MVKFEFKIPFFGIGMEKDTRLVLKKGDTVLLEEWNWRKFGYIKKFIQIDKDGNIKVTVI